MAKKSHQGNETADYKVGKWRPPREFRFQKGRSGNPKGRRKGSLNIKTLIRKRLLALVTVRENGRSRRISSLEALWVKAINDALQGRPKAFMEMFKVFQSAGFFNPEELDQPPPYPIVVQSTVTFVHPEQKPGDPDYKTSLAKDPSSHLGLNED